MKTKVCLAFLLPLALAACATTKKPVPCGAPQTGEGLSYSAKAEVLRAEKFSERPSNKAAQKLKPIKRRVALIPPRFLEGNFSGNCQFIFDVDQNGNVFNLDVFTCSSSLLKEPARRAILQWTYEVPMENGKPTVATGVMAKMHTMINDAYGKQCPIQEYPD